ncbi:MAG: SPOR domain-containing protein [Pseudomonadota bacterium]
MHRCVMGAALGAVAFILCLPIQAAANALVFGSFGRESNANAFAAVLRDRLGRSDVHVRAVAGDGSVRYRVLTGPLSDGDLATLRTRAETLGLRSWRLLEPSTRLAIATGAEVEAERELDAGPEPEPGQAAKVDALPRSVADGASVGTATQAVNLRTLGAVQPQRTETRPAIADSTTRWYGSAPRFDLGVESRSFADAGHDGQDRWQPSVSAVVDWQAERGAGDHSVRFKGFYRVDGIDDERTHGDIREAYYRWYGERVEVTVGLQQLFWGVSEFTHVVDVINQTDAVENVDFEDKLGQPMIMARTQQSWGTLSVIALPGFRERTFPGADGRLRFGLPVLADEPSYASGAEDKRLDGALRWSHFVGPLNLGLYHFSGTNRDPQYRLVTEAGALAIRPHYTTIDQTGLDAQWLAGDLNLKLELISRSGDGDRYTAGNLGFEQTFVGVGGSRTDLGLVVEYLFDDRGGRAQNTLFEQDVALGTRWAFNDIAATEALVGVIWDHETDEMVYTLEASRQLGSNWLLALEARAFSGADARSPLEELAGFLDGSAKTAFLADDDLLQLELRRFF